MKTMSVNDFFAKYEETNYEICKFLCDNFIEECNKSNPHMLHMVGSDWLSILINDYNVLIDDAENFQQLMLLPKQYKNENDSSSDTLSFS